jgi:hypothetical protein
MESDYDAQTVLIAVADNTPVPVTIGASTFVGRKATGNAGAMSASEARAVLNVADGADVTSAINVNAAGAVMESDYDAQTVLIAIIDDTPVPVTIGASTFVGRKAAGNAGAMSASEARTVLNVEDGATADQTGAEIVSAIDTALGSSVWQGGDATTNLAIGIITGTTVQITSDTGTDATIPAATATDAGVMTAAMEVKLAGIEALADVTDAANVNAAGAVMESDYDAQTVLIAVVDNTPAPVTIGASTFVGRKATGNAGTLTAAEARAVLNVGDFTLFVDVDGGGATIATGTVKGDYTADFAFTIVGWTLLANQSGSIVFDIWKDTYANYPPTVADTITASAKPTISSATKGQSTTLTGWTTSVASNDTLRFKIDSVTNIQHVTLALKCTRA